MADSGAGAREWLSLVGGTLAAIMGAALSYVFSGKNERRKRRADEEAGRPHRSAEERRAENEGYDRLLTRAYERIDVLERRCEGLEQKAEAREEAERVKLDDCEDRCTELERQLDAYRYRIASLEEALRDMGGTVPPARQIRLEPGA